VRRTNPEQIGWAFRVGQGMTAMAHERRSGDIFRKSALLSVPVVMINQQKWRDGPLSDINRCDQRETPIVQKSRLMQHLT
jgi:hypothetical protein